MVVVVVVVGGGGVVFVGKGGYWGLLQVEKLFHLPL